MYTYAGTVDRVVDGDTLKVTIDLGFYVQTRQTLRLMGVNCPELREVAGQAAKAFVESWVSQFDGKVLIQTKKAAGDKYGRWLAIVEGEFGDGTKSGLNEDLVDHGYGVEIDA